MKHKQLITSLNKRLAKRKKEELPEISVGDTVRVGVYIQEGNKQRLQPYEGTVISQHKAGVNSTITVRKIFQGVGVERVFGVYSPSLHSIQCLKRAKVRRAKLYYLRDRIGKGTRLVTKLSDRTLQKNTATDSI
uniref:ribosomal protein L19 n=1 Tax=Polulichloris maxima TaxID=2704661 RepID=UPI002410DFB2|nr:ribosomal protein L19 [Polulichloris maxima]WDY13244.1 ribosomal protein L19 [Polulichloris maxima]